MLIVLKFFADFKEKMTDFYIQLLEPGTAG